MPVEIRFEADMVKVRRFGALPADNWSVVRPGEVDRTTGYAYDRLRRLSEGFWELPQGPARRLHGPSGGRPPSATAPA
jgi:hypothetical protein